MPRRHEDWIAAYIDCVGHTEAPRRLHFWTAVSTVAGALRRQVWIEMKSFQWIPNFYIVFVAPPGIVGKSTTVDMGHDILKMVPGIKFGPNIVTWQAILPVLAQAAEQFEYEGVYYAQSPITCTASELGNLLNPKDRDLVDLLVTLWDNRKGLDKVTKLNGSDNIVNPWINFAGCVTPGWLQDNVPASVVTGGLTSRIIFIYADMKDHLVPFVDENMPEDFDDRRLVLLEDLTHISTLTGPYKISKEARDYGRAWYDSVWKDYKAGEEVFGNYIARKQAHLFKLALVIAAAHRDERIILPQDLLTANDMLSDAELDMPRVFANMGKSEDAVHAEKFLSFIQKRGKVPYEEAYRYIHSHFPNSTDFEGILAGLMKAGYIEQRVVGMEIVLFYKLGVQVAGGLGTITPG